MSTSRKTAAKKKAAPKKKAAAKKATTRRAAKPPAEQPEKGKGGRPSLYKPEYDLLAKKVCMLLGATDAQLAGVFEVCEDTINEWKKVHPSFAEALREGKLIADANVADALYQRAMGYTHRATKFFQYEGAIISKDYDEHYPPDTLAAKHWLNNRQREHWKDRFDHEHAGPNGGPIPVKKTLDVNLNDLPPEEAARIYAEFIRGR